MKINKGEELVGITKKNIRFYEEKGLISPARNEENRYREYSEEDVEMLRKIKLLRRLAVPIEEIAKLQKGYMTLEDCMRRHRIVLDREEENIRQCKSICLHIEEDGSQLQELDTEKYFQLMQEKENEGVNRPIQIRYKRYNQDLCPASLIVEVGTAGNTHAQAINAMPALADAIVALAKGT